MSSVMEVTDQNFQTEVLEAPTAVLVDFWAPWCGPCRMMAPVIDGVSKKLEGSVKVVKLNTDENGKIASDFNIQGIPSLLIFKGGKEVDRLVGFTQEPMLMEKLKPFMK
ncbi:MAG: thioredoxin [Candidatus Eremiobacteraeota bacterium]|nr:thioredoxin [Candidatus Eremiobacteraeota bacterium]